MQDAVAGGVFRRAFASKSNAKRPKPICGAILAGDCSSASRARGYVWSMECSLASGKQVPDTRMGECIDWLADVLVEWIVDGVDDVPEL